MCVFVLLDRNSADMNKLRSEYAGLMKELADNNSKLQQEEHQRKSLEVSYKQNVSQLEVCWSRCTLCLFCLCFTFPSRDKNLLNCSNFISVKWVWQHWQGNGRRWWWKSWGGVWEIELRLGGLCWLWRLGCLRLCAMYKHHFPVRPPDQPFYRPQSKTEIWVAGLTQISLSKQPESHT